MKRIPVILFALAGGVAAAEQDAPSGPPEMIRVAVLEPVGTCSGAIKDTLGKVALEAASALDRDTYEVFAEQRIAAEQMALGEDANPCRTEGCWLSLAGKLGLPFLLRTECMDVGGTSYVSTRFMNVKSRSVLSSESLEAANLDAVKSGAGGLYKHTLHGGLGLQGARPSAAPSKPAAPAPGPTSPDSPSLRPVAVLSCESSTSAGPYTPDPARKGVTAQGATEWLTAVGSRAVDYPVAPGLMAGCDLGAGALSDIGRASGARVVVVLKAADQSFQVGHGKEARVEHGVYLEAWAFSPLLGRVSRRSVKARTEMRCPRPVLAARDCADFYKKHLVADVMTQWEELVSTPADRF